MFEWLVSSKHRLQVIVRALDLRNSEENVLPSYVQDFSDWGL